MGRHGRPSTNTRVVRTVDPTDHWRASGRNTDPGTSSCHLQWKQVKERAREGAREGARPEEGGMGHRSSDAHGRPLPTGTKRRWLHGQQGIPAIGSATYPLGSPQDPQRWLDRTLQCLPHIRSTEDSEGDSQPGVTQTPRRPDRIKAQQAKMLATWPRSQWASDTYGMESPRAGECAVHKFVRAYRHPNKCASVTKRTTQKSAPPRQAPQS